MAFILTVLQFEESVVAVEAGRTSWVGSELESALGWQLEGVRGLRWAGAGEAWRRVALLEAG